MMKENTIKSMIRYLIPSVILLITALYMVFTLQAPFAKIRQLTHTDDALKEEIPNPARVYNSVPGIFHLNREKAFMEAKIKIAQKDSAGLIIDISDSLACLGLSGICLHESRIVDFSVSRIFQSLDRESYLEIFSTPFHILKQEATLAKEPIVVRVAPKDTAEAAQTPPVADTVPDKPLFVKLTTENGTIVYLCDAGLRGAGAEKRYFRKEKAKTVWNYLGSALRFKIPEYLPSVRICLPREDVLSIYRGLPFDAYLTLNL
ncbi:MAG: hypothetical protein JXA03_14890 [Bacteroidales bacterium]|nr:hypothetical protein [Bacteroidales bacterium]